MAKGKLYKLDQIKSMPNVFQNFNWQYPQLINHRNEKVDFKGRWSHVFQNNKPIILELACGYGEYTMTMAEKFPNFNFIGIDIKGNRIYTGAKYVLDKQLDNAIFVRINIELLDKIFSQNEIAEIWLPFPDPHNRKVRANRRLTAPRFLEIYHKILQPDGCIHLKTDSDLLYHYTLDVISECGHTLLVNYPDIYANNLAPDDLLKVKTRYEKLNLSGADAIKYLQFKLIGDK